MNVILLKAIRLSKVRILPAVKKQKEINPRKERLMQYLRVLSPLNEIPLKLNSNFQWFLLGNIEANSKTGNVYNELVEAGIKSSSIWHKNRNQTFILKNLRILANLPWVFCFIIQRYSSICSLDLAALQVVIGYTAYKKFFKKNYSLQPIIISDISPDLHMQWTGALAAGSKVMWWQDDYHHFKGFSNENYLPYSCQYAVILNEYGFNTVMDENPSAHIFKRKETNLNQLKKIPVKPRVGMATNAFFNGSKDQIQIINKIRKRLGVENIYFRLHPDSKLYCSSSRPHWINFANKKESLEKFANKVDVVVVGNSAVQLKLLCLGVPVIHINVLDSFGFDLYQYCQLGFIYGVKDIKQLDLESVRAFYSDITRKKRLSNYVNVNTNIFDLDQLSNKI